MEDELHIYYSSPDAVVKGCALCDHVYSAPEGNYLCPNCGGGLLHTFDERISDFPNKVDDRDLLLRAFLESSALVCAS